ncbi:MAG: site-2 protease family protein [Clostridia bacterium]|nr:site-2 protease family protein [Clostridia bacterium]
MFGYNIDKKTLYIVVAIIAVISIAGLGTERLIDLLLSVPAVLLAITVHEFGHAFAAYKFGDDTPLKQGRISLNPFDHIDPVGIAMLLFAHIGWGKPVQVNPRNYNRNISVAKADAIVSFAGPLMNFITAILFTIIYCAIFKFVPYSFFINKIGVIILSIINYIVVINIGLGIFNLIPLPPLDGSKIIVPFLPTNAQRWLEQNEQLFYIMFLALWITGIAGKMISPLISELTLLIFKLCMRIFGI